MSAFVRAGASSGLRAGVTLVELIVAVAILGLAAGVAGIAFRSQAAPRAIDASAAKVAEARRRALASGRAVTVEIAADGVVATATAFPDGRVVADRALHVEELTGEVAADAR